MFRGKVFDKIIIVKGVVMKDTKVILYTTLFFFFQGFLKKIR